MTLEARGSCALYLRSAHQDADRAKLVKIAKERGLTVVGLYEEQGAARNLPALQRAVLDSHACKFGALLVPALADLGSSPSGALCTAAKLAVVGIEIVTLTETWLGDCGPALSSISRWLAEQEATRRSSTAKESVRKARSAGRKIGRPKKTVDVAKARELLAQMPMSQVARALGAGESTVRRALASAPDEPITGNSIEHALVVLAGGAT